MPEHRVAEQKCRVRFNKLSTPEREQFLAKLVHAVLHDDWALWYAEGIVIGAEQKQLFKDVHFGNESFKGLLFFNHKNSHMIKDPKEKQEETETQPAAENAELLGAAVNEESNDSAPEGEGEE